MRLTTNACVSFIERRGDNVMQYRLTGAARKPGIHVAVTVTCAHN